MAWRTSVLFVAAQAITQDTNHQYRKPGPGDVRSPCPGLNTLANHGYLPRNGKDVTLENFITSLKDGLNVGADFAAPVGLMALQSAPLPLSTSVDLNRLGQHNYLIEHDASLSRGDIFFGDNHSFDQSIFNQILAYYHDTDTATIPVASDARYARIKTARAANPDFIYGARQIVLSYGETALYLSVMGDPLTGKAPVAYVKSLFVTIEQERLPYELGWKRNEMETNLVTLGAMIAELQLANPAAVPEGLTLGEGTLKDVINLVDPLTGQALNLTCALLGLC